MSSIQTGFGNVSVGQGASKNLTTGLVNTAIGSNALKNTTTGRSNVAIGSYSGGSNVTGSNNIFIGNRAANNSNYENVPVPGRAASKGQHPVCKYRTDSPRGGNALGTNATRCAASHY